jgi:hypothetical protein
MMPGVAGEDGAGDGTSGVAAAPTSESGGAWRSNGFLAQIVAVLVEAVYDFVGRRRAAKVFTKSTDELTLDALGLSKEVRREAEGEDGGSPSLIAAPAPLVDFEAAKMYLETFRRNVAERKAACASKARVSDAKARAIWWVEYLAGGATVILAIAGVVMALAGKTTAGVVTAAVAVLPGTGTALLARLAKQERRQREQIDEEERAAEADLQAVELTMAIPDLAERSEQMKILAGQFRQRALRRVSAAASKT